MEVALQDTLIVRRLPEALKERDLNELFHYFGAQSARKVPPKGNQKYGHVLVKFQSHEDASYALTRLHQLTILGKRIVVEYADFSILPDVPLQEDVNEKEQWKYPHATKQIALKIASEILTNSKLYHGILHLMKKLQIPLPFEANSDKTFVDLESTDIVDVEMEDVYKEDTDESELELDVDVQQKEIIPELPVRRKKRQKIDHRKKLKQLAVESVSKDSKTERKINISEMFEENSLNLGKKLQVVISRDAIESNNTHKEPAEDSMAEGFGKFAPNESPENNPSIVKGNLEDLEDESYEFITKKNLLINKLSEEEIKKLPVFKSYSAGTPNSRLYVKNIAKTVKESDLKHIYGRYVIWTNEDEKKMFDIRLMTEGRMKGQAFITLPNMSRAEQALSETNGYVLQGKPLVVCFARSAQTKTDKSLL